MKCRILRGAGLEVSEARNGAEAMTAVRTGRFRVLVVDLKLPDMSGTELCRRVKADHPGVAVLQTSAAFTGMAGRAAGLASGADAYLVEPINPQELIACVGSLLRLYHAEQSLQAAQDTFERRVAERTSELQDANRKLADEIRSRSEAEQSLRHDLKLDTLGRITGSLAHDFNNLLTVVLGSFSVMERELRARRGEFDGDLLHHLETGRKAAQDCEYLTQQLLSFARKDPLRDEVVDSNERLRAFASLIEQALGERVTLTLKLAPQVWPCRLDPGQFEAAIVNLAANARDAIVGRGTLLIETENMSLWPDLRRYRGIDIPRGVPSGDYVCITVSDTGSGMDNEVREHAFEPFFTTKDFSSGLGLTQVHGFVAQSGGHVGVASEPGQGTRIAMFLPRSREDGVRSAQHAARREMPGGTETVLVVEDNVLVLTFTAETLAGLGYRVLEALDGPRALKVMREENNIDLLLTDMVMPNDMSGIALAKEALRTRPDLKILLTSGYAPDALQEDTDGMDFAYLSKPYSPEGLAQRLREVLET